MSFCGPEGTETEFWKLVVWVGVEPRPLRNNSSKQDPLELWQRFTLTRWRKHADVVIGEFESHVQLHNLHMAANAVSVFSIVSVPERGWGGVTGFAFVVVKAGIVTSCVLMRDVTGCASQLGRCEAAAFLQT
jgi:hypothetical protein